MFNPNAIGVGAHADGVAVKHLTLGRAKYNQGAGAARNLGLREAIGEIVAFTDSDCVPDANWLIELLKPLTSDPSVGIVGGFVDYAGARHLSGRCVNFLMSSSLGGGGARDPRSAIRMTYYPRAGNMAVRRSLAAAAGGFPTTSHGEDLEFSGKILALGVRAEFVASARVLHDEQRTCRQVLREAFQKGLARTRLARRHRMHEFIHAIPTIFCIYILSLPSLIWFIRAWPDIGYSVFLPIIAYLLVLIVLAIQATVAFRSAVVGLAVPVYASLLHVGYGAGYLMGWLKPFFAKFHSGKSAV